MRPTSPMLGYSRILFICKTGGTIPCHTQLVGKEIEGLTFGIMPTSTFTRGVINMLIN